MITWKIETKQIDELIPYSKNPRNLSEVQRRHLSDSIDKFGFIDKPVVNSDGTIIGGHQRVEVLRAKGAQEIECWIPDRQLEEKEVEELNIRHNRNNGEWDFDLLANSFEVGDLLTWGFSEEDLGLGKAEKPKKEPKPQVSIEFTDRDTMMEYLPTLEKISSDSLAKMKVRG